MTLPGFRIKEICTVVVCWEREYEPATIPCLVISNLIPSCIGQEDASRQLRYCITRKCSCAHALQAHDSF